MKLLFYKKCTLLIYIIGISLTFFNSNRKHTQLQNILVMHQTTRTIADYMHPAILRKRSQKKYHLPVIGHFSERSIIFNSILEAEKATGIHYTMIFEACIGKVFKAKNVLFEFQKGNHYIKYKAQFINSRGNFHRSVGFNG